MKEINIDKIFENLHKAYEEGLFCKGCKYEKYASCGEHPERCNERIKEVITKVRENHKIKE